VEEARGWWEECVREEEAAVDVVVGRADDDEMTPTLGLIDNP
jgi:hypothetical protein